MTGKTDGKTAALRAVDNALHWKVDQQDEEESWIPEQACTHRKDEE
ncbi:hypothetical protein [Massilia sp. Root335]|jgi:hypothetical protein|nr:hypothetical protein [Massilia sp. Root335]